MLVSSFEGSFRLPWGSLGDLGRLLGHLEEVLEGLGPVLGVSWAVLGRLGSPQVRTTPKMLPRRPSNICAMSARLLLHFRGDARQDAPRRLPRRPPRCCQDAPATFVKCPHVCCCTSAAMRNKMRQDAPGRPPSAYLYCISEASLHIVIAYIYDDHTCAHYRNPCNIRIHMTRKRRAQRRREGNRREERREERRREEKRREERREEK